MSPATDEPSALRRHFREVFSADAAAAFRDWYRAQEELREEGRAGEARALADDLWTIHRDLPFPDSETRARFLHNFAVFFGSPGPAASLPRARSAFEEALELLRSAGEGGWIARAEHNYATALANLASAPEEVEESLSRFDRALEWRTAEREIARGVTLHHMGLAWRRLSELRPAGAPAALDESARCLEEAAGIRERHGLAEGRASSLFHLALSLEASAAGRGTWSGADPEGEAGAGAGSEAVRLAFERAADAFESVGKTSSAELSRERARRIL